VKIRRIEKRREELRRGEKKVIRGGKR